MKATQSQASSVSDETGANERKSTTQWVGLLGWGLARRLLLAGGLLAAIWVAVVWALV